MLSEARSGEITAGNGSVNAIVSDHLGHIVVTQGNAANGYMSNAGKVFVASTAVAGVAPGTALSTTPPLALLNPLNSGKHFVIIATTLGYVSGTLGAGSIVYAHVTPQATLPTGGTELVPVRSKISTIRGAGRVFQGSTLSGTPAILRPAYIMGAALATTVAFPMIAKDPVDGAFVIPEACAFVMQGVAAGGSSPLVLLSITWEEHDD